MAEANEQRVDIATDPLLGSRVSALRYAREMLTSGSKAGLMSSDKGSLATDVDGLLSVADWIIVPDDAARDKALEERNVSICSELMGQAIKDVLAVPAEDADGDGAKTHVTISGQLLPEDAEYRDKLMYLFTGGGKLRVGQDEPIEEEPEPPLVGGTIDSETDFKQLPVGAIVQDKVGDNWQIVSPGQMACIRSSPAPADAIGFPWGYINSTWLPLVIVSLPSA